MKLLEKITPIEENFAKWYVDVVTNGNLIEYGGAKGQMFFKPLAYGIWENIQRELNAQFRKLQVQNVYLPLLIPKSYIEKEKDHVAGFAPELATVTKVGDEELAEHLVIRPTSEVLFGELFRGEIESYHDLPLYFNQWANVVRWEKTTNPFLRNREFLWQEGHTAHTDAKSANAFAQKMIKLYAAFCENYLALPTMIGEKTKHERFAGAEKTYTIEAMMKDGRALQSGTSHYLGQNFAKAFNVQFKDQSNEYKFVHQTSWGLSTRLIGAIIMSHGDNRGIIIPPRVALFQVDILPLFFDKNPVVLETAKKLARELGRKFRVRLDNSSKTPGFKASKSEVEGTPLRLEIGPRDLQANQVTLVRRDTLEKLAVPIDQIKKVVAQQLDLIHDHLLSSARKRLSENIVSATTFDEFKHLINARKFVLIPFAGSGADEVKIKAETGATTRYVAKQTAAQEQKCFFTGRPTRRLVVFARAY